MVWSRWISSVKPVHLLPILQTPFCCSFYIGQCSFIKLWRCWPNFPRWIFWIQNKKTHLRVSWNIKIWASWAVEYREMIHFLKLNVLTAIWRGDNFPYKTHQQFGVFIRNLTGGLVGVNTNQPLCETTLNFCSSCRSEKIEKKGASSKKIGGHIFSVHRSCRYFKDFGFPTSSPSRKHQPDPGCATPCGGNCGNPDEARCRWSVTCWMFQETLEITTKYPRGKLYNHIHIYIYIHTYSYIYNIYTHSYPLEVQDRPWKMLVGRWISF